MYLLDDPLSAVIVIDEAIWNGPGRDWLLPANPYLLSAGGSLVSAPTLDELAGRLGLDAAALQDTVDCYNRLVDAGGGDGGQQRAGAHAGGKAQPVVAGVHHGGKAGNGRAQHHAFGAQVHHPGFFIDEQAQRGNGQHRAGVQRGRDQECIRFHQATCPFRAAPKPVPQRMRYATSVSQASRQNSSSPWNTPVIDLGRPRRDCASSPPM